MNETKNQFNVKPVFSEITRHVNWLATVYPDNERVAPLESGKSKGNGSPLGLLDRLQQCCENGCGVATGVRRRGWYSHRGERNVSFRIRAVRNALGAIDSRAYVYAAGAEALSHRQNTDARSHAAAAADGLSMDNNSQFKNDD
jgi:hypothetical protein